MSPRLYAASFAKLNIGLHILGRWPDGYHILETLLVPYPYLYDDIEVNVLPGKDRIELHLSGLEIPENEENYLETTYRILRQHWKKPLPAIEVYLHKRIPVSAGLGGGSSNSAMLLKLLAPMLELEPTSELLHQVAAEVGSDVPFFLHGVPMLAKGTGTELTPYPFSLEGYEVVMLTPPLPCSTKHIYRALRSSQWSRKPIEPILRQGINAWREELHNDLEQVSFQIYPYLLMLKQALYEEGAAYASMNGSGSSIYGIFPT
ncbi:MAG: 4-(cytidine 5'-diphospho)-2-C-methyl-D-erythritol kinase [Bacteroidia bacterium]|nr:4-(cytidine 5'-diphospho)-2-C-methyl-D-erythritol kinase [Bacteroidia bacterium]MDW8235897.1 4-(cytidine 5'-diphospho)-2-C-methyl-D-erythritol kinase [Bacteroidia bacterium]